MASTLPSIGAPQIKQNVTDAYFYREGDLVSKRPWKKSGTLYQLNQSKRILEEILEEAESRAEKSSKTNLLTPTPNNYDVKITLPENPIISSVELLSNFISIRLSRTHEKIRHIFFLVLIRIKKKSAKGTLQKKKKEAFTLIMGPVSMTGFAFFFYNFISCPSSYLSSFFLFSKFEKSRDLNIYESSNTSQSILRSQTMQ